MKASPLTLAIAGMASIAAAQNYIPNCAVPLLDTTINQWVKDCTDINVYFCFCKDRVAQWYLTQNAPTICPNDVDSEAAITFMGTLCKEIGFPVEFPIPEPETPTTQEPEPTPEPTEDPEPTAEPTEDPEPTAEPTEDPEPTETPDLPTSPPPSLPPPATAPPPSAALLPPPAPRVTPTGTAKVPVGTGGVPVPSTPVLVNMGMTNSPSALILAGVVAAVAGLF
ncbi:unnamed protein product [Parascedosporium putredinis]|uniref:Extracellular membrane protein CFEM domain-containing protein n=1 Tax=Parascedosporium putredinis TaxID=1442378 RepID=A0A9P1MAV6_9PEZI|nr:unnamed protein product [Parascedosporium putredinis]CAI7993463.1 unnamed protein product [Parascedosporium putredinis]